MTMLRLLWDVISKLASFESMIAVYTALTTCILLAVMILVFMC